MSDTLWGVEVDGNRVTVVETMSGIALATRSVSVGSVSDSLEAALTGYSPKKGDPPLRVCVIAPGTLLRRIDVTEKISTSRADFEEAVFSALAADRDSSAVAGVFYDTDLLVGDAVSPGIAAVAPQAALLPVFEALGLRRAEVVASPLLLSGYDGVWLGLHMAAAEVTLLREGRPVAFRQLRAGGLASVAAVLGDDIDESYGERRLTDTVTRSGVADPIAEAELARYLRMVAGEVRQTIEFWQRQGEEVPAPDDVLVYGFGAASPGLATALGEESLAPVLPQDLVEQLTHIAPSERETSLLATLASASVGEQMPQVSFVNPKADALMAARRGRRARLIKIGAAGLVAALILGFFGVPFLNGYLASTTATNELNSARAYAEPRLGVYYQVVDLAAREEVIESAVTDEADWPRILELVYVTAPLGSSINQFAGTVAGDNITVVVSGQQAGGVYAELASWLQRLTAGGAINAWTSGFSTTGEATSYQVSFRLPMSLYASPRNPALAVAVEETPATAETGPSPDPVETSVPSPVAPALPPVESTPTAPAPPASPEVPASPAPQTPAQPTPLASPSTAGGDL